MRHLLSISLLALLVSPSLADSVQLTNGDSVSGKVVSLDSQSLVLKSDVLGEVKIGREKIAAILLGDRPAIPATPRAAKPETAKGPVTGEPAASPQSVEDILKQIQAGGVDKGLTKSLESEFPLLSTPEVRAYFDKTVGGLISGDINIGDLRKQAIDVRNQVKDLERDLGPEATQALSGYMSILDKFIRETEPKKPVQPK